MEHRARGERLVTAALIVAIALAGCGGDDGEGDAGAASSTLTIGGSPERTAKVGQSYSFQPTTSPSGSGSLTFSVSSKPGWLAFNSNNGRLSGTPGPTDIGLHPNITISVSNGAGTASLRAFSIEVVQVGQSSVTLSWTAPTQNEDGSPLTDLAGYKIRYGQEPGEYEFTVDIDNGGLTTYVVDGLVPSVYYFVVSAYNSSGMESDYSEEAAISLGS